ncbi:MAG: hypothetical protein AAFX99_29310, partial [Myxococcota bacterium]
SPVHTIVTISAPNIRVECVLSFRHASFMAASPEGCRRFLFVASGQQTLILYVNVLDGTNDLY